MRATARLSTVKSTDTEMILYADPLTDDTVIRITDFDYPSCRLIPDCDCRRCEGDRAADEDADRYVSL